jgi:hypothetical protein
MAIFHDNDTFHDTYNFKISLYLLFLMGRNVVGVWGKTLIFRGLKRLP